MSTRFVARSVWYQRNQPVLRAGMIVQIEHTILSGHAGDPQPDEQVMALANSAMTGYILVPQMLLAPLADGMWAFSTEEDGENILRNVTTGMQESISEPVAELMAERFGPHFRFNLYSREENGRFLLYPAHTFEQQPLLSPMVNLPGVKRSAKMAGALVL